MSNELEDLIRKSESDIAERGKAAPNGKRADKSKLPRFSVAIATWLIAILLVAFRFDDIVRLVSGPTETKIQSDLGDLLQTTSASLHAYEVANGVLPPILPNPSIRGLVRYERRSDFAFRLRATIGDVTVVLDSNEMHPRREVDEK